MKVMLVAVILSFSACSQVAQPVAPTNQLPQVPSGSAQTQEVNDRFAREWTGRLAGRENDPAGQVFKNIQIPWLKNIPAARFIVIMNAGYSRALGVTCTHCHVESDFGSDDKRPKLAAREMAIMHRSINQQLSGMQNLDGGAKQRAINCSTCHRGAINPVVSER